MDDGGLFRNPSPPSATSTRLAEEEDADEVNEDLHRLMVAVQSDRIGSTTFSRRWALTILMDLITITRSCSVSQGQACVEGQSSPGLGSARGGENLDDAAELSDEMEVRLCQLWDAAVEADVACFLLENGAVNVFLEAINRSTNPRLTEICVGVLGNMIYRDAAAANLRTLIPVVVDLLSSSDAPTLVETTRLILSGLAQCSQRSSWLAAFRGDVLLPKIVFILSSSANGNLLANTTRLVDNLLDEDEELAAEWCSSQLVQGLLEALKQASDIDGEFVYPVETNVVLALQTLSTIDKGAEILGSWDSLPRLLLSLLSRWTAWEDTSHLCCPAVAALLSVLLLMLTAQRDGFLQATEEDTSILDGLVTLSRLTDRAGKIEESSESHTLSSPRSSSTLPDRRQSPPESVNGSSHSSPARMPEMYVNQVTRTVNSSPPSTSLGSSLQETKTMSCQGQRSSSSDLQEVSRSSSECSTSEPTTVSGLAWKLLRQLQDSLAIEHSKERPAAN